MEYNIVAWNVKTTGSQGQSLEPFQLKFTE